MKLGAFSISLNVRDIAASRQFYQALGFEAVHDNHTEGWMILRNGDTTLGLFQGIIPANTMTFNPGWDAEGQPVDGEFDDVRTLQKRLKQAGVELSVDCDETTQGPAHIALTDPDGNAILIDQHR